jgi:hypothetical protein
MKWKKIILRTVAAFAVLALVLCVVAVLLVQHSSSVRATILAKVERYASEFTGTRVTIRDFKLNFSSLEVRLEGIVARSQGEPAPPLLQIETLIADIKVDSALRGRWHLENLEIHHPVVHFTAGGAGAEKLSQPQNNAASGVAQVFDLAVRQCVIDNGEIYFNDAKSQLKAELNDLQFKAQFNHVPDRYVGTFGYSHGKVLYAGYTPVVHDLKTKFVLTHANLTVENLAVSDGPSRIEANGSVRDFSNPALQATYQAQLSVADLARILKDNSLPEGVVHASGSMTFNNRKHGSFLQNVHLAGKADSQSLQIKTRTIRNISWTTATLRSNTSALVPWVGTPRQR